MRQPQWKPIDGGTLLMPTGIEKHFFVIATAPCPENRVALVNISTVHAMKHHDSTCVLDVGDHEFIKRKSYVYYARARIEPAGGLIRGVRAGTFIPRQSVSAATLERICDGFLESDEVPQIIARYVRARFGGD